MVLTDLDRLKFLEEEIALAEKKMEYSIAMNPIVIYMRKRLDTVKKQLELHKKGDPIRIG